MKMIFNNQTTNIETKPVLVFKDIGVFAWGTFDGATIKTYVSPSLADNEWFELDNATNFTSKGFKLFQNLPRFYLKVQITSAGVNTKVSLAIASSE